VTTFRAIVIALLISCPAMLRAQTAPAAAPPAAAPSAGCPNFRTIDEFVYCQAMAILDKQQVGQNGKGSDRQLQSPSTDSRSTSLVDQSSATDFVSAAGSLIAVAPSFSQAGSGSTSGSSQTGVGTGTTTASFYALMAAFNKTNPTDPTFYKDHVFSRRISLTIGTAASTQATDNTTTPSTVYGAKYLVINHRELYREENLKSISGIQKKLSNETVAAAKLTPKIKEIMCAALHPDCFVNGALSKVGVIVSSPGSGYKIGDILEVGGTGSGGEVEVFGVDKDGGVTNVQLSPDGSSGSNYSVATNVPTKPTPGASGHGATVSITVLSSVDAKVFTTFDQTQLTEANLASTVKALPDNANKQIQSLVENSIQPFSELVTDLNDIYDKISKGRQMSISATGNNRTGQGNNNYRAEFIYDQGLSTRINWTVNGSFDYTDRKMGLDSRGGRLATSFQGNLTNPTGGWSKSPLRLIFSGEGDWLSLQKPQYSFDAQLSIPITPGFELPIEYRYANRAAQINKADSEVRFGLTVDLSRITQALK
jgi:hypothetical protein